MYVFFFYIDNDKKSIHTFVISKTGTLICLFYFIFILSSCIVVLIFEQYLLSNSIILHECENLCCLWRP